MKGILDRKFKYLTIPEIPVNGDLFISSYEDPIKKDDIMNYFVFNEDEDNIIVKNNLSNEAKYNKEKDEKKIQVNYNIYSYISSPIRPDLYSPYGIISGNKYKLILYQDKNEMGEKELKKDDEIASIESFEEEDEKFSGKKKIKIIRYFNIEIDISLKCQICGEIGHKKNNCPYHDIKFCYRCARIGHEPKDCDKYKCFKCNKVGHKTSLCPVNENQLIICEQCYCIGHKNYDCLISQKEDSNSYLIYSDCYCFNCGSQQHVLCSILGRELPEIHKEEEKDILLKENNEEYSFINLSVDEQIEEECNDNYYNFECAIKDNTKINLEKFNFIIFCGFCAGRHRNEECIYKEKFINKYDEIRKYAGKKIIEKRKESLEKKCLYIFNKNIINNNYNVSFYNINNDKKTETISLDEEDSSSLDSYFFNCKGKTIKLKKRNDECSNFNNWEINEENENQYLGKKRNINTDFNFFP